MTKITDRKQKVRAALEAEGWTWIDVPDDFDHCCRACNPTCPDIPDGCEICLNEAWAAGNAV